MRLVTSPFFNRPFCDSINSYRRGDRIGSRHRLAANWQVPFRRKFERLLQTGECHADLKSSSILMLIAASGLQHSLVPTDHRPRLQSVAAAAGGMRAPASFKPVPHHRERRNQQP